MPLEDYRIEKKISNGRYSSIYQVTRILDGAKFAMKKIVFDKVSEKQKKNSLLEVKILSTIKHPNIIELVQVFYDQFIQSLCLVLQYGENDLSSIILEHIQNNKLIEQNEIWKMIEEIASALEFMHQNNIIHRDIKAKNILISSNGSLKIADFNVSTYTQGLAYTRTGTLTYTAPQVWKGQPYTFKADIWSLGCLLYQLTCLKKPFQGISIQEIYKKIIKCHFQKINQNNYSRELRDLISFMIQDNAKLRPSATTILKMCKKKIYKKLQNSKYSAIVKPTSFIASKISFPGLQNIRNLNKSYLLQISDRQSKTRIFKRKKSVLLPIQTTMIKQNNNLSKQYQNSKIFSIQEHHCTKRKQKQDNTKRLNGLPSFKIKRRVTTQS